MEGSDPKVENPERAWERGAHRELSSDDLRILVSETVPGSEAVSIELIATGKANTNYRVVLSGGRRVVLRLYVRDSATCATEASLEGLLRGRVPVPTLIRADCSRSFSIWEWVEGTLLEESLQSLPDCAYDLGRVLARIGEFRFDQAGFLGSDLTISNAFEEPCAAYVAWMRECVSNPLVRGRTGEDLAKLAEKFIDRNEELLDPYRGASRLVHSDYKFSNILIDQVRVAGVIDWEFAHSGSPLLDVAILFRHREHWPKETASRFERGFRDHGGSLETNWLEAARYLDLMSLLDFLARPGLGIRATADVVRLISETVS